MILHNTTHSFKDNIQFVMIQWENVHSGRMPKEKKLVMGWPRKKPNREVIKDKVRRQARCGLLKKQKT